MIKQRHLDVFRVSVYTKYSEISVYTMYSEISVYTMYSELYYSSLLFSLSYDRMSRYIWQMCGSRQDVTEILLKVELNTIKSPLPTLCNVYLNLLTSLYDICSPTISIRVYSTFLCPASLFPFLVREITNSLHTTASTSGY